MQDANLISVIIATYNRCESLKDTLESLLSQDCDGSFDYEVIVVDNNSEDKTKELVESYKPKFNGKLRYLFEPKQGVSYAKNKGIEEAKGEIIAFTDDDVVVDRRWLLNICRCFQDYNCDAMGGRVLPLYPPSTSKWIKENRNLLQGPIVAHDYGKTMRIYDTKNMVPAIGANMAFKKECFNDCGLFRTDIGAGRGTVGDDTEFIRRLERKNKRIYYCGKALVWHKVENERMRLEYIAKWYIMSGRYYVRKTGKIKGLVYYFGIPRYIFRQLFRDTSLLFLNIFNKRKFLQYFFRIFVNFGQCLEYREIYKLCLKSA